MKLVSLIALLLVASPVAAQTPGTSTSQTCTQDPTYCSDIGASTSTTGSGTNESGIVVLTIVRPQARLAVVGAFLAESGFMERVYGGAGRREETNM